MRDILRVFFCSISLMSCCIASWGWIRHIKVSKKLKKQYGTDIVSKETVSKKTLNELKVAIRLIFVGSITALVFRTIWILIRYRIF
ncbi:MAG: hypothetical protein FH753_11890 [Firmicutes bacterium]|nr:hypothetical protein [Bacillota bacterium]